MIVLPKFLRLPGATLVLATVAALLAGCGGGSSGANGGAIGGGGPPDPSGSFPLVQVSTVEGLAASATVSLSQILSEEQVVHHVAFTDSSGLVGGIATGTQDPHSMVVSTRSDLVSGVHTGTVKVTLCMNANCSAAIEGSPFDLPMKVTVQPRAPLQVTQGSLSASVRQLVADWVAVEATVPVAGSYAFGVNDPGGRFSSTVTVTRINGLVQSLDLRILPIGPLGNYSGSLTLYSCRAGANPCGPANAYPKGSVTIPYTVTVLPVPLLQVSPASLSLSTEPYEPVSAFLDVTVPGSGPLVLRKRDSGGLFYLDLEIPVVGQVHSLRFNASRFETPGIHSHSLVLAHCPAGPCDEDLALSNIGVTVPYTITVNPESLLQPLPSASGVPEWETFQGNPGHTGHVPVQLDPAMFALKWTWASPAAPSQSLLSPVTTGSGKVIVSDARTLYALDESNGSIAWRHDFADGHTVKHPASWGGRAFVATTGLSDSQAMWCFDLTDGSQLWRSPYEARSNLYLSPTVNDGIVYTLGGFAGGLFSLKGTTGTVRWFGGLQHSWAWSPAVDDDHIYAHTGAELAVFDRVTGRRAYEIPNSSFVDRDLELNTAPVLPGNGAIVVVDGIPRGVQNNYLIAYDGSAVPNRGGCLGCSSAIPP